MSKSSVFSFQNILISVLLSIILFQYYNKPTNNYIKRRKQQFTSKVASSINLESNVINEKLNKHTKLFNKKEVIRANDQVYVGIGYGLANSIIIEGDTSFIIVDTLESIDGATEFRNDFNKLYNKTNGNNGKVKGISAIIFTHYHADHTQGTDAFIDDINNPPMIISHALTEHGLHRVNSIQSSIVFTRAMRQFGTYIKEYDNQKSNNNSDCSDCGRLHVNSGIGPELMVGDAWEKSILLPTKTIDSEFTRMEIDGIVLDIYYAPGETEDQIFVYLPQSKTLLPADNIYETFPNLYAIRGSPTRDALKWINSLDTMRYIGKNQINYDENSGPEYMVPCHTRPVHGAELIQELLTVYRDGIQYIHDQTLRFTNQGLTPNEMIPIIKNNMPDRLRNHPWLQEFYGTIDWSIRGIFNAYLGWFSGDAADLFPLSKSKFAQNMVLMMDMFDQYSNNNDKTDKNHKNSKINANNGGSYDEIISFMLDNAEERIERHVTMEDCQWSLDIATNLLHLRDDLELGTELSSSDINNNDGIFIKLSDNLYERSKNVRINALSCMAGYQTSANGRNYYLTSALEDSGNFRIKPTKKAIDATINAISLDYLFDTMRVRFKYEVLSGDVVNRTSCFIFDISDDSIELYKNVTLLESVLKSNGKVYGEDELFLWYKIEFRDGIMDIIKGGDLITLDNESGHESGGGFGWLLGKEECVDGAGLVVQMKASIYRELAANTRRSGARLYAQGEIKVIKGSVLMLNEFNTYFDHE